MSHSRFIFALLLACHATAAAIETHTLTVADLPRSYLLHVPAKLDKTKPAPVVLAFHGGGSKAAGMVGLTRFNAVAEREGFAVVYPEGIGGNWNDGREQSMSRAHREKIDDVGFVAALLDDLKKRLPVDEKRVFATGISNGGNFCHYLAAHLPARIVAIAPVAASVADPFHLVFKPQHPVSVCIIQGTLDPLVPYAGGSIRPGPRGKVIATDAAVKLWCMHNGCVTEPQTGALPDKNTDDGCMVRSKTWKGGREGSVVTLYDIEGGGHTWPGGPQYMPEGFIGKVCRDFDATTLIWDFFKQHPKP